MATWIMHLRLCDKLLEYGFDLDPATFYLGSLAPDAAIQDNEGNWQPSKKMTHCRDDVNGRLQPEDFYDNHLKDKNYDRATYAFLIGYYTHLLADVEWIGNVWRPLKHDFPEIAQRIETDSAYAFEFKRLQYFGHDFLYLHENPEYPAWQVILHSQSIPTPLNFLPESLLLEWLDTHVRNNYEDKAILQKALKHDFPYLTKFDLQTWLDCTTGVLIEMLKGKAVPCPNPSPLWAGYIQPYA